MIYFASDEAGRIKIGFSRFHPTYRLHQLLFTDTVWRGRTYRRSVPHEVFIPDTAMREWLNSFLCTAGAAQCEPRAIANVRGGISCAPADSLGLLPSHDS